MIHMCTHYISMHHVNHSESYPSWQKNKAAVVPINSIMTDSDEGAHIEVKKKNAGLHHGTVKSGSSPPLSSPGSLARARALPAGCLFGQTFNTVIGTVSPQA